MKLLSKSILYMILVTAAACHQAHAITFDRLFDAFVNDASNETYLKLEDMLIECVSDADPCKDISINEEQASLLSDGIKSGDERFLDIALYLTIRYPDGGIISDLKIDIGEFIFTDIDMLIYALDKHRVDRRLEISIFQSVGLLFIDDPKGKAVKFCERAFAAEAQQPINMRRSREMKNYFIKVFLTDIERSGFTVPKRCLTLIQD